MIERSKAVQLLITPLVLLLLGQVNAQAPTPFQAQLPVHISSIAGYWQIAYPVTAQPGTSAITINEIYANGMFRQTYYFGNQVAGFSEGYLTLQPDGTFTQVTTNYSPQYCMPQGCVPNKVNPQVAGRLVYLTPMAFVVVVPDLTTGQTATSSWQRVSSPIPAPVASAGGAYGAPYGGAYGAGTAGGGAYGGNYMGGNAASSGGGYDSTSEFVDALRGESPYTDDYGTSYYLPNVPDPSTSYYSPEGNPLSYNDYTGTWTETDSAGWETELESDGYGE